MLWTLLYELPCEASTTSGPEAAQELVSENGDGEAEDVPDEPVGDADDEGHDNPFNRGSLYSWYFLRAFSLFLGNYDFCRRRPWVTIVLSMKR